MVLVKFLQEYNVDHDRGNAIVPNSAVRLADSAFVEVIKRLGGKSFNNGIYRVYRGDEITQYTDLMCSQFKALKGKALVFASDWMGRQFVITHTDTVDGQPTVACLEPGVPDSFCTDRSIVAFHESCLIDMPDDTLARKLFVKWSRRHKAPVLPHQCVGFRLPLFLGGADDLKNLEMMDMNVYLEMCGQLWEKVKDLPEGTEIGSVSID